LSVGPAGVFNPRPAFLLTPLIAVLGATLVYVEIEQMHSAVYVLKPLVTLLILWLAVLGSSVDSPRYRLLIISGLALSCIGDVFLMLPNNMFSQGLCAFLVAHLFYISAFATNGGGVRASKAAWIAFAGIAGTMLALLWPTLGTLRIPVAVYVGVIATMAWQAWGRALHVKTAAARRAAAGAILFLISDGTLALNKFRGPIGSPALATFVVMTSYLAAQWCIARSVGEYARATCPATS
jgi:uncharacterized membrane protein YhhN